MLGHAPRGQPPEQANKAVQENIRSNILRGPIKPNDHRNTLKHIKQARQNFLTENKPRPPRTSTQPPPPPRLSTHLCSSSRSFHGTPRTKDQTIARQNMQLIRMVHTIPHRKTIQTHAAPWGVMQRARAPGQCATTARSHLVLSHDQRHESHGDINALTPKQPSSQREPTKPTRQ